MTLILEPWPADYEALNDQVEADVALNTARAQALFHPLWTVSREDLASDPILDGPTVDPDVPARVTLYVFYERPVVVGTSATGGAIGEPQPKWTGEGVQNLQNGDVLTNGEGMRITLRTVNTYAHYQDGTWTAS